MNGLLHLDDATIAELLDPESVTDSLGSAFAAWGRGEASTTRRVRAAAGGLMASAMAAVVPPYSGGKLYATRQGAFTFVIALFDADGRLVCTLDGDTITRLRTPAASALAIRALAAPGSTKAALIGTGRQAWTHLDMLARELPSLTQLAVCGRRETAVAELVDRARAAGIPAVAAPTPEHAVDGADVLVTVTASSEPLFRADAVGNRTLLCAVGATKYDRRELGADVVARCAAVVCDDVAGSQIECGDLIDAAARGAFNWERAIELRDLLAGNVHVPRAGDAPVLFETQGVAIQDVAVAALAYERYRVGTPSPVNPITGHHVTLSPVASKEGIRMIQSNRLSMWEAELAVDAALAKAKELGVGSVIAVVDAAGWPIVVKRPDNAKPTSVDIAINKAFTAACHRRPTHTYTNAQPGQEAFGIMNMHGGRFAIFVGGWPIEVDGEVVGGIGVSGGHTREDIACCKAGVTAVLEHLGRTADFSKWDSWQPPAPTAD